MVSPLSPSPVSFSFYKVACEQPVLPAAAVVLERKKASERGGRRERDRKSLGRFRRPGSPARGIVRPARCCRFPPRTCSLPPPPGPGRLPFLHVDHVPVPIAIPAEIPRINFSAPGSPNHVFFQRRAAPFLRLCPASSCPGAWAPYATARSLPLAAGGYPAVAVSVYRRGVD